MSTHMNKRQRKKNRTGEFTEYGFGFEARVRRHQDDPPIVSEEFYDELIEFVESKNLLFGGGDDKEGTLFGFVTAHNGSRTRSVTEDEREQFIAWLTKHPLISAVTASPLSDAWKET